MIFSLLLLLKLRGDILEVMLIVNVVNLWDIVVVSKIIY